MTISTAPAALSYSGDGSTTAFAITWKYFAQADVKATLRDANDDETTWVLNTDYTLSAAGVSTGGTLTATTAPASGETLVIELEPSNVQDTNLPRGGQFPSQDVEDQLDKLLQIAAKIEGFFNRSLRAPRTDTQTGTGLEIPINADRANKSLTFDGNGVPTASSLALGTGTDISGDLVTATDDTNARTLANWQRPFAGYDPTVNNGIAPSSSRDDIFFEGTGGDFGMTIASDDGVAGIDLIGYEAGGGAGEIHFFDANDTGKTWKITFTANDHATIPNTMFFRYSGDNGANVHSAFRAFPNNASDSTNADCSFLGNLAIGQETNTFGDETHTIAIVNGTAPAVPGDLRANTIFIFSEDVSSSAECKVMNEGGYVTRLTGTLSVRTDALQAGKYTSDEDGASAGPIVTLYRESASPADADLVGGIEWSANNSAGTEELLARINLVFDDVTDTTEDATFRFATKTGGNLSNKMFLGLGMQIGSPTGGDKGSGSLNVAADIYKNDSAYTSPDYALEHYFTGKIDKFKDNPGAADYPGLMPLEELEKYIQKNLHLPRVPRERGVGMFERGDILLEKSEELVLYLIDHEHRIRNIEHPLN